MLSLEELDVLTKKLFEPAPCEDPFCCTDVRQEIINDIRKAAGLELLAAGGEGYWLRNLARIINP